MKDLINKGDVRMTVKEVAGSLSVPETTLRDCIRRKYPNLMQNGKTTYLDEEQVTAVSIELKKAHNSDLMGIRQVAVTKLEMQQKVLEAMQWLAGENERLQAENTLLLPKGEFYDTVAESKDTLSMIEVAKILNMGMGQNQLFEYLRSKGILFRNGGFNLPKQEHINSGHFRVIEQSYQPYQGAKHRISRKTVVYQKGLDYIRKLLVADGYKVHGWKLVEA